MQRTPPRGTPGDLDWWEQRLSDPRQCIRPIPRPVEVHDVHAYSDASSGFGVAIVIGDRWRAWRLKGNWKTQGRDIQWAEAAGFELLVRAVVSTTPPGPHFKVFGDNTAVVEGWWKHSSHNSAVNRVFQRMHTFLELNNHSVHSRYVASAANPADAPSRGRYPSFTKLLPPVELPDDLNAFLDPVDEHAAAPAYTDLPDKCLSSAERSARVELNRKFERGGDGLWNDETFWWEVGHNE